MQEAEHGRAENRGGKGGAPARATVPETAFTVAATLLPLLLPPLVLGATGPPSVEQNGREPGKSWALASRPSLLSSWRRYVGEAGTCIQYVVQEIYCKLVISHATAGYACQGTATRHSCLSISKFAKCNAVGAAAARCHLSTESRPILGEHFHLGPVQPRIGWQGACSAPQPPGYCQ